MIFKKSGESIFLQCNATAFMERAVSVLSQDVLRKMHIGQVWTQFSDHVCQYMFIVWRPPFCTELSKNHHVKLV